MDQSRRLSSVDTVAKRRGSVGACISVNLSILISSNSAYVFRGSAWNIRMTITDRGALHMTAEAWARITSAHWWRASAWTSGIDTTNREFPHCSTPVSNSTVRSGQPDHRTLSARRHARVDAATRTEHPRVNTPSPAPRRTQALIGNKRPTAGKNGPTELICLVLYRAYNEPMSNFMPADWSMHPAALTHAPDGMMVVDGRVRRISSPKRTFEGTAA